MNNLKEYIPYREIMEPNWGTDYKPLKLTGRWKITYVLYVNEPTLWLEYEVWIFKYWVHEDNVVFRLKCKKFIGECNEQPT